MVEKKITNRQLRSFGFVVGAGFAVIAVWPLIFRGQSVRTWALTVTFLLTGSALVFPKALRPFRRVWMAVGETLGWVNTRILLSILYYLVIVPIGAMRRMTGNDPMRRKFEPSAATYKVPRTRRPASHMQRQY